VLGKPPLIAGASTTICTRFNSRAAPLCQNLDGSLCPTLTAHSEPLLFSELAETGSRQVIHISIRVLGWISFFELAFLFSKILLFGPHTKSINLNISYGHSQEWRKFSDKKFAQKTRNSFSDAQLTVRAAQRHFTSPTHIESTSHSPPSHPTTLHSPFTPNHTLPTHPRTHLSHPQPHNHTLHTAFQNFLINEWRLILLLLIQEIM